MDHAVAHALPAEIDEHGIIGVLRVASLRVLQQVADRGHVPDAIILDGTADWFTAPQPDLLTILRSTHALKDSPEPAEVPSTSPVYMEVKADARCAVVVATGVLVKVERDHLVADLGDPDYGWASNKGYVSSAHIRGLTPLGASDQHRRSWHLPGLGKRHRWRRLLAWVCGPEARRGQGRLASAACRLQRLGPDTMAR